MDSVSSAPETVIGNGESVPSPPSNVVTTDEAVNGRPVTRNRESSNTFLGKHRLAAAINQLNLQIQYIQEELEQLETFGESSLVCKEFISSVESSADALLPMTKGPVDNGWDRWFQGTHRNRKRWI